MIKNTQGIFIYKPMHLIGIGVPYVLLLFKKMK